VEVELNAVVDCWCWTSVYVDRSTAGVDCFL